MRNNVPIEKQMKRQWKHKRKHPINQSLFFDGEAAGSKYVATVACSIGAVYGTIAIDGLTGQSCEGEDPLFSKTKAQYRSSSICWSWVVVLSKHWLCCSCFSLMAWNSYLKKDWTTLDDDEHAPGSIILV